MMMMTQWKPAAVALLAGLVLAGSDEPCVGTAHAAPAPHKAAGVAAGQGDTRMAVVEVERDFKGNKLTRRFRMALDGTRPASLELDDADASYDITLVLRDDDGSHADLQMHMRYSERRKTDTWRAKVSTNQRVAIGKASMMSAVEGKHGARLRVTVTLN